LPRGISLAMRSSCEVDNVAYLIKQEPTGATNTRKYPIKKLRF